MRSISSLLLIIFCIVFTQAQCQGPADLILEDKDVLNGAERLDQYLGLLQDKRVGLLVNHSSLVEQDHLIDVLISHGVDVRAVFSPEHGFTGKVADGEKIADGTYGSTGIPIVSLYGSSKKPSTGDLEHIDVMVFDMQDVGTRFYTYISTMQLAMEACGEHGVQFIILDRPNPNGFYVDGPLLDMNYKSFVGMQPIPVVHGMTVGELGMMYMGEGMIEHFTTLDLTVIPVEGYDHSKSYDPPVAPSPNLPNLRAILLYPSLCFFEGTSVSVGRGTDHPFQCFGHPEMIRSLKYFGPPISFTPVSRQASLYPKHEGVRCVGVDLRQMDPTEIISRYPGIQIEYLLFAYQQLGDALFSRPEYFDKLAGNALLRQQIKGGNPETIRNSWAPAIERFKRIRKKYLLYPDFE